MINLMLRLFVKDYKNVKDETVRRRYGSLAGFFGIIMNLCLCCAKFIAGTLTGAISVTADAFNNLSDAGSSLVTLVGFKIAAKKGDKDHPFGHGRAEYIAGLVISFVIVLVGFELFKESLAKIITPQSVEFNLTSAVILGVSVAVKLLMCIFNTSLGKRIGSATLRATATDCISDAVATSAVLAGLIIGAVFGTNVDGWLGVIVSLFIVYSGINAARDTLTPLMGTSPDPELVAGIQHTVMAHDEILGIHDLVVHDYGPSRLMITLHAEIDCNSNLIAIHDKIDLIENELRDKFRCLATIHMDPVAGNDEHTKEIKAQIKQLIAEIDPALSFHDFRIVDGPTHTNLVFDIVVPFKFRLSDEQLIAQLKSHIHDLDERYFAVIDIDHDYSNLHK